MIKCLEKSIFLLVLLLLLLVLLLYKNFYFKMSKIWQRMKDGVGGTAIFRPWVFLCVLLLFMSSKTCSSIGDQALAAGQNLTGTKTLISQGGIFELGFFSKGKDDSLKFYLGIWYKNFADQTIVWVANRDQPLSHSSYAVLELSEDGNLVILDDSSKIRVWTTNLVLQTSNSTEAVLLRDGNFVLRNSSEPSIIYWQSFDHPTDTWLAGATLGTNKLSGETTRLISWKNSEDPAPGMFSVELDPNGSAQFFIEWNMSRIYWSSGLWNGQQFSSFPEIRLNYIYNYSFVSNEREHYFIFSISNNEALSRMVIEQSGQLRQLTFAEGMQDWDLFWTQPAKQSDVFALCGPFGIFNEQNPSNPCACLQGFESLSETQLNSQSSGCVRKTPLQCESKSSNGKADGFLSISNVKFPANSKIYSATNGTMCKSVCMQNCSCTAYAYNSSGCSIWEGALLNLQSSDENNTKQDIYIKLAKSELQDAGGNRNKLWVIAIVVPLTMAISSIFIWHLCRRKYNKNGTRHPSEDLYLFDFDGSSVATDRKTKVRYNLMNGKKYIDLPFFSFVSVSTATGGFSSNNKLGEGGFGPVYKGKLLKGQEIAVKRLSKRSGQGLEEFRNEVILIAKLQHQNLVRLLGCCIEQDENILIYEYMPNKSLDFFLFDSNKRGLLDWKARRHIVEGIAQGLLYLHQHSRLRIIHRDLKASNILLDAEMNPKISDFGMARMFRGNELQANTKRVVGTYGYMAPEYAMEGRFSIKSDIFSFGVLLLEILSGKRNSGFYHTNYLNLIVYTWDLWTAGKGLDLLDPILDCPSSGLRYINIGLLCVQDNPANRPTTTDVVAMLGDEVAPLPTPKQPAFCTSRAVDTNSSSPNKAGTCSVNGVTISTIQGR